MFWHYYSSKAVGYQYASRMMESHHPIHLHISHAFGNITFPDPIASYSQSYPHMLYHLRTLCLSVIVVWRSSREVDEWGIVVWVDWDLEPTRILLCVWMMIYLWCVVLGPSWAWLLGGSCLSWAASHWNRFLRHGDSSWRTWYQSTYQRSGSRHQYGSYSIHLASIQHTIFPSCASTSQIHTSHPTISLMSSCSSHHELVGIVASGWGTRYRVTIHPQRRGL